MKCLNPKAMEHRTRPLDIYITPTTSANEEGDEDYNLDDEAKGNHQWEDHFVAIKLLNIVGIVQKKTSTNNLITSTNEPIWYYVEIPHTPIVGPLKLNDVTINLIALIELV